MDNVTVRFIYQTILTLLVIYSLLNLKKIRQGGGGYLVLALVLSFLADFLGRLHSYFPDVFSYSSLWTFNLYTIAAFPVYLLVLRDGFSKKFAKAINYTAVAFVIFGFINFIFLQGVNKFNNYTLMLGAVVLIVYSLLYYKNRFDNPDENLLKSWRFWVGTDLLLYFTGTLFYFGFMHYLSGLDTSWLVRLNVILQAMNVMLYSIFGVALLCLIRQQKLSQL